MVEFRGRGEGPCPTHTLLKQLPRTFSYILLRRYRMISLECSMKLLWFQRLFARHVYFSY
jgi:hypothetical protein